jgi:hypothetical protein
MAKVTGPLFSIEARGKIADAMVHFPWKGINVVRGWVKPANVKSEAQGNVRLILGGLGRAMSTVNLTSLYKDDLQAMATGTNTWVSEFIQFAKAHILADTTALETEYGTYFAHTNKADFIASAVNLGLTDLTISYAGTTALMPGGFIVYLLARTAIEYHALDSTRFNRAPYTTALSGWSSTQTDLMETDLDAA